MKTAALLLLPMVLWGQSQVYTPIPPTMFPGLDANLNSKPSITRGTGAPTSRCTAAKDLYVSTAGAFYICVSTNVWSLPLPDNTALVAFEALLAGTGGAGLVGFEASGTGAVLRSVESVLNSAFLYDIGYDTADHACAAAVSAGKPLAITGAFAISVSCSANLWFPSTTAGIVTPTADASLTGNIIASESQQIFDMSGHVDVSLNARIGSVHAGWFGCKADGTTDDTACYTAIRKATTKNQAIAGKALVGLILKPGISMVQPGQVALTDITLPTNCYTNDNCYAPAFVVCGSGTLSLSTCTLKAIAATPSVSNFVLSMQGMIATSIKGITIDGSSVSGCLNVDNGLNGASPLNELTGLYIVNCYGDTTSNAGTGAGGGIHAKNNNNSKIENNIHAGTVAGYTVSLAAVGGPIYDLRMDGSTTTGIGPAYLDAQNFAIRNTYLKSGERSGVNSFNLALIDNTQIVGDSVSHIVLNHTPINSGGGGWGATVINSLMGPGTIFAGAWNGAFTTSTMFDTTGFSLFGTITNPNGATGTSTFFFHNSTWFNTAHSFTPFTTPYNVVCYSCYDAVTNTIFDFDGRGRVPFGGLTGFYGSLHAGGGYSANNYAIGHQNFPDSYNISGDNSGSLSIKAETAKAISFFIGAGQVGAFQDSGVSLTANKTYSMPTGFFGPLGGSSTTNFAIGHPGFPASFALSGDNAGFTSIKAEAGKSISLFIGPTLIGSIVSGGMNLAAGQTYAVDGLGVADGTSAIVVGGTLTCPGGQHIASLNISQRGVPTGTCN